LKVTYIYICVDVHAWITLFSPHHTLLFILHSLISRSSSWAEGDLVAVVVAVASVGLGVIGREEVGVGALVGLAHQVGPVAAREGQRHVEAVDDGDVVKVLAVADGELGQRQRRLPGQRARQSSAAVARLAPPGVAVEAAARAAPHPAGGRVRGDVQGPRLAGVQLPTAADRGGSRPHRVGAVVSDVERRCARASREHGQQDDEDRGRSGCCHCFKLALLCLACCSELDQTNLLLVVCGMMC
jgi:hypothetical protein